MTIPEKLLKPYNPTDTEQAIYDRWVASGFFNPDNLPARHTVPFSIVLPPPNVTGTLHVGHALMLVIQDIMIRFERMRGKKTLWIPGTDHAAIATQSKVEKMLEKEGLKKRDMGRDAFLERVNQFAQESHDTIVGQIKKMGASIDWSREAYTLDEARSKAVRIAFKKMYDDGLIYRGARIINWDPKLQTTISDDEIVYVEERAPLYYLKYGPFTIATARPETKFGDKYVMMHPNDERYTKWKHGDTINIEWINGPLTATIIKDEVIDMAFGTGVMTITPWHSAIDFQLAEKHSLDKEQIIDWYGKLLPIASEFASMPISKARLLIIEKLQKKGLVEKVDDAYTHSIATSERSGATIEPQIKTQWFVNVDKTIAVPHSNITGIKSGDKHSLKDLMHAAVAHGQINILPNRFAKVYFHWVNNLHDWCISRQLWFGHRIPVWYRGDGNAQETFCGIDAPADDAGGTWTQDEDTLDTWFSSGMWTFTTLGWPEKTKDFDLYHPTDVLETGYDIILNWVTRMVLMSTYLLGDIPFKTVYLHGIVRDSKGRKMSKSLGNILDPLDVIKDNGTDALRMALIIGTAPGNDSKVSPDKIKAYKLFANKLWNISRFVLSNIPAEKSAALIATPPILTAEDQTLITEWQDIRADVTTDLIAYRFYLAGEKLYHYVWHRFADIIIEESKTRLQSGDDSIAYTLFAIYKDILRTLHPFMPYITEELWSLTPHTNGSLLMIEPWPEQ